MSTPSIHTLAARLAAELFAAYGTNGTGSGVGGHPLRDAFASFGRDAARVQVPLEDTMAAGIDTLQAFLDRRGGDSRDPSTVLAAGIALSALARAYHAVGNDVAVDDGGAGAAPLHWLAAVHRIVRTATSNLELAEMLQTSVRVVAQTTGADACAVVLYDETRDSLELRAAVGLNPSEIGAVRFRLGVGITGLAAAERRVVAAPDARAHTAFQSYPPLGEDLYASQISVPMLIHRGEERERLVGVLNLLTLTRREFSDDEIAFLQTVAGELAIGIENAELYSRTDARLRRTIAELRTLQRVSHTIASTLDLDAVLRLIAEQAMLLINAEAAAIFRLPHPSAASNVAAGVTVAPTIEYRVGRDRFVADEPARDAFVKEVMRTGTPDAMAIEYDDGGSNRLFCLPLRSARETLGALCLRLAPDAELSEDDLGLLQAFSDSATLAIENARLYQDARYGLETASALLQEMHHRVRNNLQTVAALLSLHLRRAGDAPWAASIARGDQPGSGHRRRPRPAQRRTPPGRHRRST